MNVELLREDAVETRAGLIESLNMKRGENLVYHIISEVAITLPPILAYKLPPK